jgi:hypothetical protein
MKWHYDGTDDSRIYMGLDRHLYRYNVADDYYEYCDSLHNLQDSSGNAIQDLLDAEDDINDYVIKRLWDIDDGYIYGAGWKETRTDSQTVVLFKWDLSGDLDTELERNMEFIDILDNVFTGERTYHEWDKVWPYGYSDDEQYKHHYFILGYDKSTDEKDDYMLIPFNQVLDIGNPYEAYPASGDSKLTNMDLHLSGEFDQIRPPNPSVYKTLSSNEDYDAFGTKGYVRIYGTALTNSTGEYYTEKSYDENPHFNISYGQKGLIELNDNKEFIYATVEKSNANKGAVHHEYWDNHSSLEGYRRDPYLGTLLTDTVSQSGNRWELNLNQDLETDSYNVADFNGCQIWIPDPESTNDEFYGYILDFHDSSGLTVTELSSDSKSWDDIDLRNFIITAPHYKYHMKKYDLSNSSAEFIADTSFRESFDGTIDEYEKGNKRQPTCSVYGNNKWHISSFYREYNNRNALQWCYISTVEDTSDGTNIQDLYAFYDLVILDMRYDTINGTDYILFYYIDLEGFGTSDFGKVGKVKADGSSVNIDVLVRFSNIPIGFSKYDTNKYYLAMDSGLVYDLNVDTGDYDMLGHGDNFVDDESNLASNLVSISPTEINTVDDEGERQEPMIFGVSSPTFPIHTQENKVNGKYYLWKFDNYLPDRIELADFSDMSIWEAMSHLIRFSYNYVGGFAADEEGSFFLKEKNFDEASVVLEVSDDVQDDNLHSLEKDRGLDEIYNDISLVPHRSKIEPAEFELTKTARDVDQDTFINTDDVNISVDTKYPINLTMVCTRGGDVNVDFTNVKDCPLFRWQMQSEPIEVRTLQDADEDTDYILVHSTFRGQINPWRDEEENQPEYVDGAVNIGDYIKAVNNDNTEEKYYKVRDIRPDATYGFYRIIDLETDLDFKVEEGTVLEVTEAIGIDDTQETFDVDWSSEGIGTVMQTSGDTFWIDKDKYLANNLYINIGDNFAGRISKVGVWNADKGGWEVETVSSSGQSLPASSGDTVEAYYSPCKAQSSGETGLYDFFDIGGTNVKIKISPSNNTNVTFKEGDKISVTSEGLVMEEDKASKQVSKDVTSIDRYGESEYSDVNCRFLTDSQAYHYVRKIRSDFSYGRYNITATIDYAPDLDFLEDGAMALIKVHNHPLFRAFNSIKCYIKQIIHKKKSGVTVLKLKAVDFY